MVSSRTAKSSVPDSEAWGSLELVTDPRAVGRKAVTMVMSAMTAMTAMVKPKRIFGFWRIAAKEPLIRSPIVSGRSGMMPGLDSHPHWLEFTL